MILSYSKVNWSCGIKLAILYVACMSLGVSVLFTYKLFRV